MDSHKDQIGIDLGEHLVIRDPENGDMIWNKAYRQDRPSPKQKPKKNGEQNEQ